MSNVPIRAFHVALVLALAFGGCGSGMAPVTTDPTPDDAAYEVVKDWPAFSEGAPLGEAAGVGVDSHGHVFVFHRAGRDFGNDVVIAEPTVMMLDGERGTLLAQWGAGMFVVPHGLAIDKDDRVWLTDVKQNRVYAFSHDGERLLAIGAQ